MQLTLKDRSGNTVACGQTLLANQETLLGAVYAFNGANYVVCHRPPFGGDELVALEVEAMELNSDNFELE